MRSPLEAHEIDAVRLRHRAKLQPGALAPNPALAPGSFELRPGSFLPAAAPAPALAPAPAPAQPVDDDYAEYLAWMRDPDNGFVSCTVPFRSGIEVSVFRGVPAQEH